MNIKLKLLIFCCFALTSCTWLTGVEKLGDKIYRDDNIIVITGTDEYKGIGKLIVPPKIKKIEKDSRFVIIMALNGKNNTKYWLIDKSETSIFIKDLPEDSMYWGYSKYSNVYGPLDSLEFINLKIQKGVKLEW